MSKNKRLDTEVLCGAKSVIFSLWSTDYFYGSWEKTNIKCLPLALTVNFITLFTASSMEKFYLFASVVLSHYFTVFSSYSEVRNVHI